MTVASGPLTALLAVLASSPLWILLTRAVVSCRLRTSSPQIAAAGASLLGLVPTVLLAVVLVVPEFSSLGSKPIEVVYPSCGQGDT
jgi:hypothetical protein